MVQSSSHLLTAKNVPMSGVAHLMSCYFCLILCFMSSVNKIEFPSNPLPYVLQNLVIDVFRKTQKDVEEKK